MPVKANAWDDDDDEDQHNNNVQIFEGIDYEPPKVEHHSVDIPKTKAEIEAKLTSLAKKGAGTSLATYDEENLETPWLPPALDKAVDYRTSHIFRSGTASLWSVNMCNSPDLGVGVSLYFQFIKSMTICLLIMSILSVPNIMFAWYGSRIAQEEQDALGLYRFTLGNIGYNKKSTTYSVDSACSAFPNSTNTCIRVLGNYEIPLVNAASILTACEILQVLVFFITIGYLKGMLEVFEGQMEQLLTSVTDYSVMVTNLPKHCEEAQLIAHFSHLYPLDKPDWKGRPPLHGARPVEHCDNSQHSIYLNTWVAECNIFRRIGSLLRTFKSREHLTRRLQKFRAQMKMFAPNTPHSKGPNPKKFAVAERNVMELTARMDLLAEKVVRWKESNAAHNSVRSPSSPHISNNNSPTKCDQQNSTASSTPLQQQQQHVITIADEHPQQQQQQQQQALHHHHHHNLGNALPVAAFVVFEYSESMARCIEDYNKYSTFPRSLFFPKELLFEGKRLVIKKAAEPDQIGWEYLEVSNIEKKFRRFRSVVVALILLLVCFVIIVQGSIYKTKFSKQIPELSFCSKSVPELFGSRQNITDYSAYRLTRPVEKKEQVSLDAACSAVVANTFYAVMTENGDYYYPVGDYDISSCRPLSQGQGLCPHAKQSQYCPCVSIESNEMCETLACSSSSSSSSLECEEFPANVLGSCYCFQNLLTMLTSGGVSGTLEYIRNANKDVCYPFFITYSSAVALTYGATVVTVVINAILGYCLVKLTAMEGHGSVDKQEASQMTKLFVSTYFNMGLVVLLAFGYVQSIPDAIKPTQIFQGTFDDFTAAWYGNVGNYLVVTFVIQAISAPASRLLSYWILMPFSRCMNYPSISSQRSYKVVMQQELNEMEVGEKFNICSETALAMALLFFAMTYAPGLPVLMPLACITFAAYFQINKLLLCRYHERPAHISDGMIRTVLAILPYAAIIRLGFACWMLGNPDIFPDTFPIFGASAVSSNSYVQFLDSYRHYAQHDKISSWLVARLGKPNIFPILLMLVLTVLTLVISHIWKYLPIYWLYKLISMLVGACCRRSSRIYAESGKASVGEVYGFDLSALKDPLRQEMAPYTGDYFRYLLDREQNKEIGGGNSGRLCSFLCCRKKAHFALTEEQQVAGWVNIDQGRYMVQSKVWTQTVNINGVTRLRNSCKRTYEIVNEYGCSSYDLSRIPAYKLTMTGLKEGAKNLKEYREMKEAVKLEKEAAGLTQSINSWAGGVGGAPIGKAKKKKSGKAKKARTGNSSDEDEDDDDDDSEDSRIVVKAFDERPHYGKNPADSSDDDED